MIQRSSSSNRHEEETEWNFNRKILGSREFDLYFNSRFPHSFEFLVHVYPSSDDHPHSRKKKKKKANKDSDHFQSLSLNKIQRSLQCPVAECITRTSLWFFCQHYLLRTYSGVLSLRWFRIENVVLSRSSSIDIGQIDSLYIFRYSDVSLYIQIWNQIYSHMHSYHSIELHSNNYFT